MTDTKTTLFSSLLAAQQDVGGIGHDKRNEFSRYDYTSSEAILTGARAPLHAHGLLPIRPTWKIERTTAEEGIVTSTFQLIHVATGETLEEEVPWPAVICKGRPWDKAIAGALTTAWNYWLRDILAIPRPDKNEMDGRDDEQYTPPPKQRPAPPALQKPPVDLSKHIAKLKDSASWQDVLMKMAKVSLAYADGVYTEEQHSALVKEAALHGVDVAEPDEAQIVVDWAESQVEFGNIDKETYKLVCEFARQKVLETQPEE